MAKPAQILQIEPPAEITFKGPFTDVVTSHIKMSNPSDKQVCFKVKTTAPKQYCVRPNSGLIPAHGVVSVSVMLQPFDYTTEEPNKHKFMVQTAFVPDGEQSLDNIWKNTPANEMMDSKLRVKFDSPDMNFEKSVQKLTTQSKLGSSSVEAEIRRTVDDGKRLHSQLQQMEQENNQLRERVKQLESRQSSSYSTASSSIGGDKSAVARLTSSFTIMHIGLAVVLALLVGLLLGKIF